jgi:hypothetical protein
MVTPVIAIACLVLGLSTTVYADEPAEDRTTKVTGTAIVPKGVPSFEGRILELRLYATDPRTPGRAAELVDTLAIKDFTHIAGKETKKEFVIGKKGELKENLRYYLTAFVMKRDNRTHIGQADHVKIPLNKVITDGNPRTITLRFKELEK